MIEPYHLPPEDSQYLDRNYPSKWRKVVEGNGKFGLLIDCFPISKGYNLESSTLMVLIPIGYPGSMLDMFYFDPPLEKLDRTQINALATESHFGRIWQRWSRHYPWQPGVDSIVKHIEYVKNELDNEVHQ